MSHSHIPVRHLLKQVEIYRATRAGRDGRPGWVTDFIDRVAELFEPFTDVGRVGFECQLDEDRWVIGMYLGTTEIVGGPEDGFSRATNFQFDLGSLLQRFGEIDRFLWSAFPDSGADDAQARSFVTIDGRVEGRPLRLRIFSVPPRDAGPGFRQYADGRRDPV